MKTYIILFIVIIAMHVMTFVNTTIFDGEWNGIVLMISNALFLIAAIFFGTEFRARKRVEEKQ
ncbi:hypothetical protein LF817_16450 [Halobacillus sp. A1]|uniref:hypothetical protein n=1 Tax=Halobacillus sp. A1 TaxID=2880262 RepID=UPI0020A6373A|nr:hypothetical protein [Halobacillus sp. A1]MCP3032917.1 hypothetical protein [Halobacillus sp. A1]